MLKKISLGLLSFFLSSLVLDQVSLGQTRKSENRLSSLEKENRDFKKCRDQSLKKLKQKKISIKFFKKNLATCREKFPGAGLYIICKKNALKTYKTKPKLLKKEISSCKKLLNVISFSSQNPLPFVFVGKNLYFAGIGFNKPLNEKDIGGPNFNCKGAKTAMKDYRKAEYHVFGNDPRVFGKFKNLNNKELLEKLDAKAGRNLANGIFIKKLGKLYGNMKTNKANLYFPSGSCLYSGDFGNHFTGLSAYYLVDKMEKKFIPYFAIAFYHPNFKGLKKRSIISGLLEILQGTLKGSKGSYKVRPMKTGVQLIAMHEIKTFDQDGEPKNLCQKPIKNQMIAIVKSRNEDNKRVEFILVANIKNLCTYGENLFKSF